MEITKTIALKSISGKEMSVKVSATKEYSVDTNKITITCAGVTKSGYFTLTENTQTKVKSQLIKVNAVALFASTFPVSSDVFETINNLLVECEKEASTDLGYIKYSKELKENAKMHREYKTSYKKTIGALNA